MHDSITTLTNLLRKTLKILIAIAILPDRDQCNGGNGKLVVRIPREIKRYINNEIFIE